MRKPIEPERLYLDFDGFFASVEQQARPGLRGKPVGVVPFADSEFTCVIACSREAKLFGVKNVMPIREARNLCPDIIFVPQSPDLYRRAHNALLSEIEAVIPIDAVKSIDELTCRLEPSTISDPEQIGLKIKRRLCDNIGPWITCSIGFAANRQLAKMACKAGKKSPGRYGDGLTIWHPRDMPAPLLEMRLEDVPGIGTRMQSRLYMAAIINMKALLETQPKQLRQIWGNVTGERLWYALHGYDVQSAPSARGMYGHGRVLPPDNRSLNEAQAASRLLLVKAARRMRRDNWNAGRLSLYLNLKTRGWEATQWLPAVRDDQAVLAALAVLWRQARAVIPVHSRVMQVHVTLYDLTPATARQLDMLLDDDRARGKWQAVTDAVDKINTKYSQTLVSLGPWSPPAGGYAGGKISYTRIPDAEDFW